MKKNLLVITAMSVMGLAYSGAAMADLKQYSVDNSSGYHCGFKDKAGKVVVPANKYEACGEFVDGLAYVGHIVKPNVMYEGGGYKHVQGFIDKTGKLVIPVKYDVADGMEGGDYKSFSEGLVLTYKNGLYGYMDKQQKLVIPHKYEHALNFHDGVAVVLDDGLYGVIDKDGKVVVPIKHSFIGSFGSGLAPLGVDKGEGINQYGYINKKGAVVIKPTWSEAYSFSEGLAAVRLDSGKSSKWGVIDTKGNYVVKPKHDDVIIQSESDEFEFNDGHYINGKLFVYDYVNPKKRFESKIIRTTLDKTGKSVATKTYNNWGAVITEFANANKNRR